MRHATVSIAPLLLTVPDTARRLNRHEQTVRAMIRRGDLAAVRLGRLVRVLATAVDRFDEPEMAPPPVAHAEGPRRSGPRLISQARA
jgi:excisionase family DNA binding protein